MSVFSDFFGDIKNFFSVQSVLGIDIGTVSMKLVEVSRAGGALTLETYGMLETKEYLRRANAALQTSSLRVSEQDIVPLLQMLVRESGAKGKYAIASLPTFSAFFMPLDMPAMPAAETAKAISFQAKQYIPLKPEEVSIDWLKLGESESEGGERTQRVLLTGIPNGLIERYRSIFRSAGLTLIALEIETHSLARALAGEGNAPRLVLDIGGESSSAIIVSGGVPHELGQTDYGGLTLTQSIGRSLGISPLRAEDLKRRRGLSKTGSEYELSTSLYPFLDVIIQEARRVRDQFEQKNKTKVQAATLTGGGANLVGIDEYLQERLGIPVAPANVFQKFRHPLGIEPALQSLNRELAVSLGLALRHYHV